MALDLLDRKLLFVTGKGGVGKTTVAASIALLAAQRGKRTLVAEVDAKGNLADFFETGPTTFKEREVVPGLWAMTMDTEESLKEYLSLQLKIPLVARIGPLARTFDFVANAAPGVKEVLTVGKFLWEVKERTYDLVVVDAVATGHVIAHSPGTTSRSLNVVGPVSKKSARFPLASTSATSVRLPCCAASRARDAATVVLPTPPLPVTKRSFRSSRSRAMVEVSYPGISPRSRCAARPAGCRSPRRRASRPARRSAGPACR